MTTFRTGIIALAATGALSAPALAQTGAPASDARTGELPIAVQMYTMRNAGTLDEQLAAVQAAGITAVETVNTQGTGAQDLKAKLDAHEIEVISSHVPIDDLRSKLSEVVAFNKAIGNDTLTVPHLKPEARPTDEAGWRSFGAELKAMAETLKAEDMRLAYHNHDFEMVKFGDRTALEILLEAGGPDLLSELDLAWVARGGYDPAEFLGRLDGRVFAVHAKDNAPEGEAADERGFAAIGKGVLDWSTIIPAAEKAGVDWYIIEHDLPKDAPGVVKTGAEFLTANLPEGATR